MVTLTFSQLSMGPFSCAEVSDLFFVLVLFLWVFNGYIRRSIVVRFGLVGDLTSERLLSGFIVGDLCVVVSTRLYTARWVKRVSHGATIFSTLFGGPCVVRVYHGVGNVFIGQFGSTGFWCTGLGTLFYGNFLNFTNVERGSTMNCRGVFAVQVSMGVMEGVFFARVVKSMGLSTAKVARGDRTITGMGYN